MNINYQTGVVVVVVVVENDRAEWSLVMISDMKQHGLVAEADLI